MSGSTRTTVVVGVGEGLGESVARRFARGGDRVALVARSEDYLTDLAADLTDATAGEAVAAPADVSDPDAVAAAFDRIRDAFGPVDAMVDCLYSTRTESGGILEVDLAALRGAWAVETAGAFLCAREVARDVVAAGGDREGSAGDAGDHPDEAGDPPDEATDPPGEAAGSIVFTNSAAARRPSADGLARASARAGLRGLAASMARDLGPRGVHVAHVVVDGWIATPELLAAHPDRPDERWLDPDRMADTYWHLVEQGHRAAGFEVDLRTLGDDLTL